MGLRRLRAETVRLMAQFDMVSDGQGGFVSVADESRLELPGFIRRRDVGHMDQFFRDRAEKLPPAYESLANA